MDLKIISILILLQIFGKNTSSQKITPTKFDHQGVYKLENQNDGSYLTRGGENGSLGRTIGELYNGSQDQKWLFSQNDSVKGLWTISSFPNGQILGKELWTITYVGHGKYQLRNQKTGKCLQNGRGSNYEADCIREKDIQRWFPHKVQQLQK